LILFRMFHAFEVTYWFVYRCMEKNKIHIDTHTRLEIEKYFRLRWH